MYACVCVDRRFTSHRGLHFPANRFNFTFSIELEFSFTLFPLYISLSISQFLFVCVRRVFRSLFRLHIHGNGTNTRKLRHIHNRRRINWEEARTLQFICIYFIIFIYFTTLESFSLIRLFFRIRILSSLCSPLLLLLRLILLAQTGKSR